MTNEKWGAVDAYFESLFTPNDEILEAALEATVAANMPMINVSPTQGKLLYLLARINGAKRILEVGTLAGYSTIWLARALPEDGQLITLEVDPKHAEVANANIERAGFQDIVDVRVGAAIETLPKLVESGEAPFDLVFIDADKVSTPDYLAWALKLTKAGSLIIIDNVVRHGEVSNADTIDPNVQGVRRALEMIAENPRLDATAIQTVGSKGYDGLSIAIVKI